MSEKINEIIIERDVPAKMRDGVILKADIYRPKSEGRFPVLLERTPYNKNFLPLSTLTMDPITAAQAGYVVVIQDVRGRFQSEGAPFYMYKNEFNDGYDSVEWAATLPYSDGNVGMFGASYMGATQWQAAVMEPPHLKAIFPVTWATDAYLFRGGAFELGLANYWTINSIGPDAVLKGKAGEPDVMQDFMGLVKEIDNMDDAYGYLPIKDAPWLQLGNHFAKFYEEIIEHELYDEFHENLSVKVKPDKIKIPAFCLAGWYDLLLGQDLEHYKNLMENGKSQEMKDNIKLMIGPWAHASFANVVGDLNFGLASSGLLLELKQDLTKLHLQWFDYWLKGIDNGISDEAPVKIFVMGQNKWREEQEWPLARTQYIPYYLHSSGNANTRFGDGFLSIEPPTNEEPDQYVYDPNKPVLTNGGNILMTMDYAKGPLDQSQLEERKDILVYTTDNLDRDIEVTGPVVVKLYASSSAVDTDFVARLIDVHPDGKAYNIADGIIRARFRNKDKQPSFINPGEVYEYHIDLLATSNLFKKGHRIRIEITSSNFPRYDLNPNTGKLSKESEELLPATQTIFHNEKYPSQIILPIIP